MTRNGNQAALPKPTVQRGRRMAAAWAMVSAGLSASLAAPAPAVAGQLPARAPAAATARPRAELPPLRLDDPAAPKLALLGAFRNAEVERPGAVRLYLSGPWGQPRRAWHNLTLGDAPPVDASAAPAPMLSAGDVAAAVARGLHEEAIETDGNDEPSWWTAIWSLSKSSSDPWADDPWSESALVGAAKEPTSLLGVLGQAAQRFCRRRPVKFVRYGGEADSFPLVRCDGSVAPEAFDRLTLMARPPEVPRPGDLLPDAPDSETWNRGEWLDQVRPVHPRLLWLLQRVADAFPWRGVYVFSGYRPPKSSASHSFHGEARAMDISVMGIRNEDLFRFCRTLADVGCGYYPNSKFVHVDVRRPGTGRAFWVDASGPGEPSRYVDSWPGVIESGAMVWDPAPY
jgi:hypothetical protein